MRTALGFHEDDEDPLEVESAFERGPKRVTVQPSTTTSAGTVNVTWTWTEG